MKTKIILAIIKGYGAGCALAALRLFTWDDATTYLLGIMIALFAPVLALASCFKFIGMAVVAFEIAAVAFLIRTGVKKEMPKSIERGLFFTVLALAALNGYLVMPLAFMCGI